MRDKGEAWSGQSGFILATIGSAIGIGSIWKCPDEVGAKGGGTCVIFYIAGLILIVVPLMLAEFAIGRRGHGDPATSLAVVAAADRRGRAWSRVGILGVVTGFLILSFYSVIGGIIIGYGVETAVKGLPGIDAGAVRSRYEALVMAPSQLIAYHAAFMTATGAVVMRGVSGGVELACKVLMPILLVLMLLLAGYSMLQGDLAATLRFLFMPDPAHLTARAALEALGLGFFSIGVGLGLMITYAAYSGAEIDLKQVAIVSVVADTGISFLAGLAVFPIVFAHGLDPAGGPGLVFITLPLAFAQMPFGRLAACAFFLLLFVAALSSAISMLELVVSLLVRRFAWQRVSATLAAAATCFVAGIASVFSFNLWSNWHPLGSVAAFEQATFFDLLDHLTSNILLPFVGLAIAVFAGWAGKGRFLSEELRLSPPAAATLRAMLRYVVPAGIVAASLSSLFG